MSRTPVLLQELLAHTLERRPDAIALRASNGALTYADIAKASARFKNGLGVRSIRRGARIGLFLDKRPEFVAAVFGCAGAGTAFVPINPILKPPQVGHIVRDCSIEVFVTSHDRYRALAEELSNCPSVRHIVTVDNPGSTEGGLNGLAEIHAWNDWCTDTPFAGHRVIDTDILSIFYTSGSTGKPKGVVLSHRNMVCGAQSVASYLGNHEEDIILAALPLSFDAGFSQLTTAFSAGASVVLLNYLMPRDVVNALVKEGVTGITAVPPLYIQLANLEIPTQVSDHLRYFANTGGRMPRETLQALRAKLPKSKPFLMYGLTEAFRSTYLPPEEVDRRADSIGKAIPNAEILVLRPDGTECAAGEAGELVHRGALVGMGYWNDPEKTAERYKPLPHRETGFQIPEYAVFSGDLVRKDEEGFLYFVGRNDEMIKTSGYRVSPTEVEECLYSNPMVRECAVFGVAHPVQGQTIRAVVYTDNGDTDESVQKALVTHCRNELPLYMVPTQFSLHRLPLPRNANGKIDRKMLSMSTVSGAGEPEKAPR